MLLLLLFTYVFSVAFVQFSRDTNLEDPLFFGSMGRLARGPLCIYIYINREREYHFWRERERVTSGQVVFHSLFFSWRALDMGEELENWMKKMTPHRPPLSFPYWPPTAPVCQSLPPLCHTRNPNEVMQ